LYLSLQFWYTLSIITASLLFLLLEPVLELIREVLARFDISDMLITTLVIVALATAIAPDLPPTQHATRPTEIRPPGQDGVEEEKINFHYDVVLSFAGENRTYVEEVAQHLRAADVRVFYDVYERAALWGKDLYIHLDNIYRKRGRYCVIFASRAYRDKLWTNHELRSAQARALESNEEYILPARFDDTEIPGIRPTVSYEDLRHTTPQQLAILIREKLSQITPAEAVR
jgi:hypothetical protein